MKGTWLQTIVSEAVDANVLANFDIFGLLIGPRYSFRTDTDRCQNQNYIWILAKKPNNDSKPTRTKCHRKSRLRSSGFWACGTPCCTPGCTVVVDADPASPGHSPDMLAEALEVLRRSERTGELHQVEVKGTRGSHFSPRNTRIKHLKLLSLRCHNCKIYY
jgi:hypothetical protein